MSANLYSTNRPILHIAACADDASARVQSSLQATGREILLRDDLYRGMGALAAARRRGTIEAVVISTRILGPGQEEFFQILSSGSRNVPNVPVVYYGPTLEGPTFAALAACGQRIHADDVPALFEPPHAPRHPAGRREARAAGMEKAEVVQEPDASARSAEPATIEPTIEPDVYAMEGGEFGPLDFPQGYEEELHAAATEESSQSLGFGENPPSETNAADRQIESDFRDSTEVDSEPRTPVPWRPGGQRPQRTPPGADNPSAPNPFDPADQDDTGRPLLTQEELDALLGPGSDDASGRDLP